MSKTHYEHEVVRSAFKTVLKFTKTDKFGEAYVVVLLIDKIIHLHGGFHSEFFVCIRFDRAKYRVGVSINQCCDHKLYAAMLGEFMIILQETLGSLDTIDIELFEL